MCIRDRVSTVLEAEKLPHKRLELEADRLLIRFSDSEEQLKAADILKDRLGRDYIVALNLASSAPSFLRALGPVSYTHLAPLESLAPTDKKYNDEHGRSVPFR